VGWARSIDGRDDEALAHLERAIAVADSVGEPVSAGVAHSTRGIIRCERGEGKDVLRELGIVMERSVAAAAGMAISSLHIGMLHAQASAGMLEEARQGLVDYVAAGADGGLYVMTMSLCLLARTELAQGSPAVAMEHATRARAMAVDELANPLLAGEASRLLAASALADGEASEAERLAHEALGIAIERGFHAGVYLALDVLACAAAALEGFEEAARILGAAERAREEVGRVRWVSEQRDAEQLGVSLLAQLGASATRRRSPVAVKRLKARAPSPH